MIGLENNDRPGRQAGIVQFRKQFSDTRVHNCNQIVQAGNRAAHRRGVRVQLR